MMKNVLLKFYNRKIFLFLLIFITAILLLQSQADSLVASFLKRKLPPYIVLSYDDIRVNFFTGKISLEMVKVDFFNRDGKDKYAQVTMESFSMAGLSYWQFWIMNSIHAEKLKMEDPIFKIYPYLKKQAPDAKTGVADLKKSIVLETFELSNGKYFMMQDKDDSLHMSALDINFMVKDARIDKDIIRRNIPIEYGDYGLTAADIYVDLNTYEKFNLAQLKVENELVSMKNFSIHSKYSKSDLSSLLTEEREHLAIDIESIDLTDLDYGFKKETFFLKISQASFNDADIFVHLDKQKNDRTEKQNMYSKTMRELPIDLDIKTVVISKSKIAYEEKMESEREAGRIFFEDVNANIQQLSNSYPQGQKTKMNASALFMGASPISLDCNFDINEKQDAFTASGTVAQFNSASVNQFLMSNLNVKAEGEIERLFFTISGDAEKSSGDMKVKYENFSFTVFKEDKIRVKKVITAIGNALVNSGGQTDTDGFRHGKISISRDPSKSFFNYLWINVTDGLKSVVTGNGKKDN